VKTSALTPPRIDGHLLECSGTLIRNAEARMGPVDGSGRMVPILIVHARVHNPAVPGMHYHGCFEQPFPAGAEAGCAAAAKRLRKGAEVRVQAPLAWVTLHCRHTAHIHALPPREPTTTTTPSTTEEHTA
jgi:hypothetical protein